MIDGVPKLIGEFRLFVRHPEKPWVLTVDDRWTFEKIDETHFRVSPSLLLEGEFHTTNPFIVEVAETKLTCK